MSQKLLLTVAQGQKGDRTPVWLMRQAGRYLKEYRDLREKHTFLETCQTPELAAEVSLQPMRRFDIDGVILFSDIMIPTLGMGVELDFAPGPVLKTPIRSVSDIKNLRVCDPHEKTSFVLKTLQILKSNLPDTKTLIGFCGAPFTTACYLVEGKHSTDFSQVKKMMKDEPVLFHLLLDKLSQTLSLYLKAQVEAGAEVVQIFDTWTEILTPKEYLEFAFPYEKKLIESLRPLAPVILFMKKSGDFLTQAKELDVNVFSVDYSVSLSHAREVLGDNIVLQGNLDPKILQSGTKEEIKRETLKILNSMSGQKHIFNLAHGVLPETPVENVSTLIEVVRNYGK